MLEFGHQLAVKTAHGVPGQEPDTLPIQVQVDLRQLRHQGVLAVVVLFDEHQLELAVDILNDPSNFFVLRHKDMNISNTTTEKYFTKNLFMQMTEKSTSCPN